MRRATIRVSVLLGFLVLALPAMSAEGRTPVFLDGTVIAADGKYFLSRNIISGGAGTPVIDIAAPKVDLDLNGFTIFGSPGAPAILISTPPVEVRIHNGTIAGGDNSILRPTGAAGRMVVIEDVRSQDAAAGPAFFLQDIENVAIRRNNIIDSVGAGIRLDTPGALVFRHGQIVDNAVKRTGGAGIIVVRGAALEIAHNQIEVAGNGVLGAGTGITLQDSVGCLLLENVISDPSDDGIFLIRTLGSKLFDNIVRHAFVTGIHLDANSNDNHLYRNVATDCGFDAGGAHGLRVESSRNDVNNNTFNSNSACGMLFDVASATNVLRANTAFNNGLIGGVCPAPAACGAMFSPDSCDASAANLTGEPVSTNNLIAVPF
jgi:parallel beta-helix repeat protein